MNKYTVSNLEKIEEVITPNNNSESIRRDAKGYPIKKGNKQYKVTFKDMVSKQNLVDFINIEEFKKYNLSYNSTNSYNDSDNASCSCEIF